MDGSVGKESACNTGNPGLIPGSGRSTGEGIGLPTPIVLGFPGGWAGEESTCNAGDAGLIPELDGPLEKGTATHSSILAKRIPWTSLWSCKESDTTEHFSFSCMSGCKGYKDNLWSFLSTFLWLWNCCNMKKIFKKNILKTDWGQRQNKFSLTIFIPHFLKLTFQSNTMTAKNISEFLEKVIAFIYLY